jgi:hypothetical protein
MGDDEHRWRQEPYQFTQGGPYWVPPAYNSKPVMSDDDDEEGSRRGQGRQRAKRRRRSNTDFGGRCELHCSIREINLFSPHLRDTNIPSRKAEGR